MASAGRVLTSHEVSKRVESDLWRFLRSLHAALELEDEDVRTAVRVRCESGMPSLLACLDRLNAPARESS